MFPNEPNLYGYLTGLEYLQLAGGLRGLPEQFVDEQSQSAIGTVFALWLAVGIRFPRIRKGMKQRILYRARGCCTIRIC